MQKGEHTYNEVIDIDVLLDVGGRGEAAYIISSNVHIKKRKDKNLNSENKNHYYRQYFYVNTRTSARGENCGRPKTSH